MAWVFAAEAVPQLVAGLAMVALAGLLQAPRARSAAGQAFAVFLVLRGSANVLFSLRGLTTTPALDAALSNAAVYALLALPFTLVVFAWRCRHGRSRRARADRWVVGLATGGALLLGLVFLADHDLFGLGSTAYEPGSGLDWVLGGIFVAYGATALVLGWRPDPSPVRDPRAQPWLVAAFVLVPAFWAGYGTARWLGGTGHMGMLSLAGLAAMLVAVPGAWSQARHAPGVPAVLAPGTLLLVAFVSGALALEPNLVGPSGFGRFGLSELLDGVWSLAFVLVVVYSLVRHRLFGIELVLKRGLRQGTFVAGLGLVVLGASAAGTALGGPDDQATTAVVTTVLVVAAIVPLQGLGRRFADRALPDVEDTPAYLNRRKLDVYRAAVVERLEHAGEIGPDDEHALAELRGRLGLSQRDHAIILHAIQSGPGTSAGLAPHDGTVLFDRFEVERTLKRGARATTVVASDRARGERVVVKLAPDEIADGGELAAEGERVIEHPHVVRVLEAGRAEGWSYIVLEYARGGSLAERLAEGPLDRDAWTTVARGLLQGLAAIHEAGIIHRDVKPSNVLLTEAGEALVTDLGVARLEGIDTTLGGIHPDARAVGTARYMAPEQAKAMRVTHRADLYAAALTLYEAWTGEPYLQVDPRASALEVQMAAASVGPFDRALDGPEGLRAWFARALAPDPEDRFADAREMADALERSF